jgi:hypothetical protein
MSIIASKRLVFVGSLMLGANAAPTAPPPDSHQDPTRVSILVCFPPNKSEDPPVCEHMCSGSLIAPNAVLTARHCLANPFPPFGKEEPLFQDGTLFAYFDPNPDKKATTIPTSKLQKIASVHPWRAHHNQKYPADYNIGVAILEDCQHDVKPVKVATMETESLEECTEVSLNRHGIGSDGPSAAFIQPDSWDKIEGSIMNFESCKDILNDMHSLNLGTEGFGFARKDKIVSDLHFCMKSEDAICIGNLGAGIVTGEGDEVQLIGTVGFTNSAGTECDVGPKIGQRIAPVATWLDGILRKASTCPGWDNKDTFTSYPVPSKPEYSDEYLSSRCKDDEWQCFDSQCIPRLNVCDKTRQCKDGSDEDSLVCEGINKHENKEERNLQWADWKQTHSPIAVIVKGIINWFKSIPLIDDSKVPGYTGMPTDPKVYEAMGYGVGGRSVRVDEKSAPNTECNTEAHVIFPLMKAVGEGLLTNPTETLLKINDNIGVYMETCEVFRPCHNASLNTSEAFHASHFCQAIDRHSTWLSHKKHIDDLIGDKLDDICPENSFVQELRNPDRKLLSEAAVFGGLLVGALLP